MKLWDKTPGEYSKEVEVDYYKSDNRKSDGAVIIFPGGGYSMLSPHEGKGYAEYLNSIGIDAFVVEYRVAPYMFPLQLVDARRAVRYVRYYAEKFGINKNKIAVMGSSAGGHLAALTSTYRKKIEFENTDEIDQENCIPNYQILCYPVICGTDIQIMHFGSYKNLMNEESKFAEVSPDLIADEKTPPAFIWHTFDDGGVNVINSFRYAEKLRNLKVPVEMHIFPNGHHGLGLAKGLPHVAQWAGLLKNWFIYNEFLSEDKND